MPNRVYFIDDSTPYKVLEALTENNSMDLRQSLAAVKRLKDAGIQLVENAKAGSTAPAVSDTE